MDELDELLEMLPKGSFKDKEQLQSFVSENGVEELFDGIEEGVFKDKDEFVNYFSVKKKEESQSTSESPELVSEETTENGLSATPQNEPNTTILSEEVLKDEPKSNLVNDIDSGKLDERINELGSENDASKKSQEEKINNLLERYKNDTVLSVEDFEDVSQTVKSESEGDFGFFGNIKNKITSSSIFGGIPNPFYSPEHTGNRKKEQEIRLDLAKKQNIKPEEVVQEVVALELKKQRKQEIISSKKEAKTEEFIETLSSEEQSSLKRHFNIKSRDLTTKVTTGLLNIESTGKQIKAIDNQLAEIKNAHDETKTDYPEEYHQRNLDLLEKRQVLAESLNSEVTDFGKNQEGLLSTKEELDMFKRNYGTWANFSGKLGVAGEDLALNAAYLYNDLASNIPLNAAISETLGIGEKIDERKKIGEQEKELLRKPKSVSDISDSWENLGEWALDLVAEQAPNTALMALTGGASLPIMGVTSAGGKLYGLDQEVKNSLGAVNYSDFKRYSSAFITGFAEAMSEKISLGQISKAKRVFGTIAKDQLKDNTLNYIKKNFPEYVKDIIEEGGSESLSQFAENLTDKYMLGKDVDLTEGLTDAFVSGAFMSGIVYKMPGIAKAIAQPFIPKDTNQKIGENFNSILKINEELKKDLQPETKQALENKKEKLITENKTALDKDLKNIDNLSKEQKGKLLAIENEKYKVRKKAKDINEDENLGEDAKKSLLNDLSNNIESLDSKKESILKPKEANAKSEEDTTETQEQAVETATPKTEDQQKQDALDSKVKELEDKRNELRGEDGSVSNENMAEWRALNKDIIDAKNKAERADLTGKNISIKSRPKSETEDAQVLVGDDAVLAEKFIEKIISSGIEKGLSNDEILQKILKRYSFSITDVEFLSNHISDRNSDAPEIGNNKQSFPSWRKGKYDSQTKAEVKPTEGVEDVVSPTVELNPENTSDNVDSEALGEVSKEDSQIKKGVIEVKPFKKGSGGTLGVFKGEDGKVYKSNESLYNEYDKDKKEFYKKKTGKQTDEHAFLNDNKDLKHLAKAGELVETSEGTAFEIENLNEVKEWSLTLEEINTIQETISELNKRGVFINDLNSVMRRENGEIVLIDLSHASKRNPKNELAESVSDNVIELLSPKDQSKFYANRDSNHLKKRLKLFDIPTKKTEFVYYLTQRPPSIGTHPDGQIKDAEEFNLGKSNRKAYKITYDKPLSKEDIRRFELTEEMTMSDVGRVFQSEGSAVYVIQNVNGNEVEVSTFFGGKGKSETLTQRGFTNKIINNSNETTPSKNNDVNGDVSVGIEPSVQQGESNNIQEAVDGGNAKGEVQEGVVEVKLGKSKTAQTYKVTKNESGELEVRNKKGGLETDNFKDADGKKKKGRKNDVLFAYADTVDLTEGEKAIPQEGMSSEDMDSKTAKTSKNPAELAEVALRTQVKEFINDRVDTEVLKIIDYIKGKVKRGSIKDTYKGIKGAFLDYVGRDKEKEFINNSNGSTYLRRGGQEIDTLASELSGILGREVTEQEIVDIIINYPNGQNDVKKEVRDEFSNPAKQNFTAITGLPSSDRFLQKAVDQAIEKENLNKDLYNNYLLTLTDAELLAIEQEQKDYEKATIKRPESISESKNTKGSEKESGVRENVDEQDEGKKPDSKQVAKDNANAKIDAAAQWLKDNLPSANDPDLNVNGVSQDQLIDLIAQTVKHLVSTGIDINAAIKQVVKDIKDKFNIDVDIDKVNAKLNNKPPVPPKAEPNQTFKRKSKQKSLLTRAATGGGNTKITDALKKHGLDYEVENQEEAKKRAEAFVKDVGKDVAIEALKNGTIQPGAELAFIYSTVIDVLESEAENATGKKKEELEDKYAKLQEEIFISFDTKAREFGRFLSALNNIYNSSHFKYNLAKQVENYKARNPEDVDASGNIPADVMKRFKERDAQLKAYEKEIQDLKDKLEKAEAQQAVDDIKESVDRENDSKKGKKPTLTPKKRARKNELRKKFFGTLNDITRMATLLADPEFREYISLVLEEAKGDFENFSKTVVKELGKHARKHLPELFKEAGGKGDVKLSDLGEVTIDEDRKITIPKQLIRDLVESGIHDIDELSQTILDEYLADEDVTLREVRDAITGYGKTTNHTEDKLGELISELKNLGRILSGHEDVDKGQRPKRSGYQRRTRTDKELREERILKDRMRDLPADQGDIEKQWKTQLDAVKSRLKNQIRELEYQIKNKEKSRPEKQPVEYDQDAKDLVEQRNALKAILENIVGKAELTREQKIQRVEKALETSIQKLEDSIKSNSLAFKTKTSVTSDKIKALKARQAELRKELNDMREASGLIEKRRNENRIKAVKKRLAELQEKRKNKDYSKKKRKELPVSKELSEIQRKYNKEKEKYDQEAYEDELRKMKWPKKAWKQFVNLLGLQRVLLATGEFSFVFLQNAVPTINMMVKSPLTLGRIVAKTVKAYSKSKYEQDYAEMESHALYELAVKSKLALTRTDFKMNAKEEVFQSDVITSGFKLLGKSLDFDGKSKLSIYNTILKNLGVDVSGKSKHTISEQIENSNPFAAMERFTTTYGNHIKMDMFGRGVRKLQAEGKNPVDHKDDYKALANAINTLTGRASLGRFDSISPELNALFFSARFAASTFNKLNPYYYAVVLRDKENPTKVSVAQKLAISQGVTYIATTAAFIMALQAIAGEDEDGEEIIQIETNPTSSDYGKLKIGNIRFDPWGGHLPWVVLISRMATGKMKRSNGKEITLGEGYNDTRFDKIVDFGVGKLNPTLATGVRFLRANEEIDGTKRDKYGNEVSVKKEIEMMYPIYWQGIKEVVEENPEKGKEVAYAMTALGFLGINNQVYGTSGKALFKSYAKDSKNEMSTKRSQYLRPNDEKITSDADLEVQFESFKTKHEANYKELLDRIKIETRTLSSDEIHASLKSSGYSEEARSYLASGLPPKMTLIGSTTTDNKLITIKDRLQKKDEDKFQTIVDDVLKKEGHYNFKAEEYNRYLESLYYNRN